MTDASWHEVAKRIADILADELPTYTVHLYVPRRIQPSELPAVVITPRAALMARASSDQLQETRTFEVAQYLSVFRFGVEGEAEENALETDALERVTRALFERRRLQHNGDNGLVNDVQLTRDTGLQILEYPGGSQSYFLGTVLELTIERRRAIKQKR